MADLIPAWRDGELQPVEKLQVHREGLRHRAISVFLMDGDRVLIQKRAATKYHTPGLWANTCCTHPHWGEESAICAPRRLDEELGISGVTCTFRDRIEYLADVGGGLIEHEVVDLFTAERTPDMTLTPNPEGVAEVRWIALDALCAAVERSPHDYTPWLRIYLAEHMTRIFADIA